MGHLRKKYTKKYFTGQDKYGNKLNYGVEGYQDFLNGKIRPIDFSILEQINFKNKNVLEIGFGRGEAIKYSIDHKAKSYIGVDFAKPAFKIASSFLKKNKSTQVKLFCEDALTFLKKFTKQKKDNYIDIVLILDTIEHIPRKEFITILSLLKKIISPKSLIVINTPEFKIDNDVISNGLKLTNLDNSDKILETSGMHCNKYTVISLQEFMKSNGFLNITESHFYIPVSQISDNYKSYQNQWGKYYKQQYPIKKKYKDDYIEPAFEKSENPLWIKFKQGNLKNISLLLTEEYQKSVYPNGGYDQSMIEDLKNEINTSNIKVIFDVGGFMGVSSLLFAKLSNQNSKTISFEPNPYNLNRMLLNFSKNSKLNKKISTYNIALSNKEGIVNLFLSENIDNGHSSTSRLDNTHVSHSKNELKNYGFFNKTIKSQTLDKFIKLKKIKPDVIKVDIEGAEHLFLLGAQKFLKNYSPILYIELHSQYCALKCTEIMDLLNYKNQILFEEPDNRILVKFYKNKVQKVKNTANINEITQKIIDDELINLKKEIKSISHQNSELKNKLTNLNNQKIRLEKKMKNKEKYLIKLIENPVIKNELKLFRIIKKIFNHI